MNKFMCFQCGYYKRDCAVGNSNIMTCTRYELSSKYVPCSFHG